MVQINTVTINNTVLCCFNLSIYLSIISWLDSLILDQAFAKSTDNISERASSRTKRATANPAPPDPLSPKYWADQLKLFKGAFATANKPNYFTRYKGKDKSTPAPDPLKISDKADELAGKAEKVQICVYRCMLKTEAESITLDLTGKTARTPCNLFLSQLTGHIGHHKQAKDFCLRQEAQGGPKVLVEFLLKPNAHELLFSPEVAALGSKARKNTLIAETAKQKNLGVYVVKGGKPGSVGEGYMEGFIGIKPEGDYYSLALQAAKGGVSDNNTKRLVAALTQSVRVIDTDTLDGDLCDLNPPLAPTEPPVAPTEAPVAPQP